MAPLSIITGISGQDGAYLAHSLLEKGHEVIGVVRHGQALPLFGLEYLGISSRVHLIPCDLCSPSEVGALIKRFRPNYIYNLAAQSSVRKSFQFPCDTISFNIHSVITLLEAIRLYSRQARMYQASSSDMFGLIPQLPISADMAFHPLSPYAVSKASAHWIAKNYREAYGLFVACGILFNHESFLRSKDFFVKKIICEGLEVVRGERDKILVGNLAARRDFGAAWLYVKPMHLMLEHDKPDDFLICSGASLSLQEIATYICQRLDLPESILHVSPELFRPLDISNIYGDPSKAKDVLGWECKTSFFETIDQLIAEEVQFLET